MSNIATRAIYNGGHGSRAGGSHVCDDKTVEQAFRLHDIRLIVPSESGWGMTASSRREPR